jgi:DNA-binding response OmpR family regulator
VHAKTGIIIISAKNLIYDKIDGLNLGADDYLPKPLLFTGT